MKKNSAVKNKSDKMDVGKGKYAKVDVKKILPFKSSFLLIDEILFYKPGQKVVAQKYLTGKEWYIKGHFPNNPLMPGHLIAESMAQACALFFEKIAKRKKRRIFYLASSKVRFFRAVRPKDTLIITAYPIRMFSRAGIFKTEARVKNNLVAKGEFTLASG